MERENSTEKLDISLYWNFTLRYKIYIRVELWFTTFSQNEIPIYTNLCLVFQ